MKHCHETDSLYRLHTPKCSGCVLKLNTDYAAISKISLFTTRSVARKIINFLLRTLENFTASP